jgi:hypothetical protein
MLKRVLLVSFYIPTVGPRLFSVGGFNTPEELIPLKQRAKNYMIDREYETMIAADVPSDLSDEDMFQIRKELLDKVLAKYAGLHPEEMASEDEAINYNEEDIL